MVAPISILQLDHGASLPSRASKHHNKENKGCAKSRLHRVLTHFGQPIFNFLSENSIINGSLLESSLIPKSFNDNMAAAPPTNQNTDIVRSCHTLYGLKVYKADQTFKYLLVHAETTSKETVQQALKEFDICEPTCHYSLCEVSVGEGGLFKQSRLPDHMHNLAGRIGLNSRYYLKESGATDSLMPDELVPELIRDSKVQFLQLNSAQVAIQLTLQDFSIFKQIESTEYVDHIFKRQSRYGTPVLSRFAELVNREMFWVITEVCSELNVIRRSKIIKQFVKLARECKVCNNFNSMFAILSGLGYRSVARLKLSWERLPAKYQKMFSDLEEFMDTSRNMSKYRQYVSSKISNHPIIPFYPLVNKDLTFIHEGNETYIDGLINFEKLRKFSSVVRWLNSMCSCPYDLFTTLEQDGQTSSTAMKTLNLNLTSGTYQPNEDCSTLNRRNNSSVTLNAKKLFEEAQMVRRVKEYLNNIRVITDEEKLYVMSLMCEAPLRKRQPSPGVSNGNTTATRKNSSTGTKFGVDSALSVRKLLSLSEPIKYLTHQPRSLTQGPEAQHPAPGAPSKAKPRRGSFSFATSSPMLQQQQHSASTKTIDQRKKTVSDTVLKDTVR